MAVLFSVCLVQADTAYAAKSKECRQAEQALKDAQKSAENQYKTDVNTAQTKLNDVKTETDATIKTAQEEATKALKECGGKAEYCTGYINANLKIEGAREKYRQAEITFKKDKLAAENKKDEAIKPKQEAVVSACKENVQNAYDPLDQETNTGATEDDIASQEKVVSTAETAAEKKAAANATQKAEDEAKKATEAAQKTADDSKKAMLEACKADSNSSACKSATDNFNSAVNDLNEKQSTYNTAKETNKTAQAESAKATREANNAKKEDEQRAQAKVDAAQSEVDKYCDKGGKKYNASKCNAAKQTLAEAESDDTYQSMMIEEESNENSSDAINRMRKDAEQSKLNDDPVKAAEMLAQNSDAAIKAAEGDVSKLKTNAEETQKALDEASKAVDAACTKPKSKACKEAKEAYATAENKNSQAQRAVKNAENNVEQMKERQEMAKKTLEGCESGTNTNSQCAQALVNQSGNNKEAAKKNVEAAQQALDDAKKRQTAANKALDEALTQKALACQDPESEACKVATENVEAAQNAKEEADKTVGQEAKNLTQANIDLMEANEENEKVQDDNKDALIAAKTEEACKKDPNSEMCKTGKALIEEANLRNNAEAECQKDPSSEACIKGLDALKKRAETQCEEDPVSEACLAAQDALLSAEITADTVVMDDYGVEIPNVAGEAVTVYSDGTKVGRFEGFNYDGGDDVLDTITRRAAKIISGIKPLVYTFAGFGLIAFAWMAIFNKISWKWFANIAMGLFLVANMGRLIEYFVTNDDKYAIGSEWQSGKTSGFDDSNRLASAFQDTYIIHANESDEDLEKAKGEDTDTSDPLNGVGDKPTTKELQDLTKEMLDEQNKKDKEAQDSAVEKLAEEEKRKFCQGGSGSKWSNIKNCLKDVKKTAQKAKSAYKAAKSAVDFIDYNAKVIKSATENIKDNLKDMKGANLSTIVNNIGDIARSADTIVSAGSSVVGNVSRHTQNIANDIQDIGKSTEQLKAIEEKRSKGEATNKVSAFIEGQKWNQADKKVEYGADGKIIVDENIATRMRDGAKKAKQEVGDATDSIRGITDGAGYVAGNVEDAIDRSTGKNNLPSGNNRPSNDGPIYNGGGSSGGGSTGGGNNGGGSSGGGSTGGGNNGGGSSGGGSTGGGNNGGGSSGGGSTGGGNNGGGSTGGGNNGGGSSGGEMGDISSSLGDSDIDDQLDDKSSNGQTNTPINGGLSSGTSLDGSGSANSSGNATGPSSQSGFSFGTSDTSTGDSSSGATASVDASSGGYVEVVGGDSSGVEAVGGSSYVGSGEKSLINEYRIAYENAVKARDEAAAEIKVLDGAIDDAKVAVSDSQTLYNYSVSLANDSKIAYEKAEATNSSNAGNLGTEYENSLTSVEVAYGDYVQKQGEYDTLVKRKSDAQQKYEYAAYQAEVAAQKINEYLQANAISANVPTENANSPQNATSDEFQPENDDDENNEVAGPVSRRTVLGSN